MITKAAPPAASRARLRPILAAYQPRRRSRSPACLICRDSWVYSPHRPLGADAGATVDSWSRLIPAPACWLRWALSGGSSWAQAAEQPAGDLGGALLLTHAGVEDQHRPGQGRDDPLQHLELALGLGHVLGGVAAGLGAAGDRDLAGLIEPGPQGPGPGRGGQGGPGQGGLGHGGPGHALLAGHPALVGAKQ